jgi:hypothetical protein
MEPHEPVLYLEYVLSACLFVCGVVVATGLFMPPTMPQKFRIMFGVVMLLYGVYRFINLRIKQQQRNEDRFLS